MRIDNIDLAAAIVTSTGHSPKLSNKPNGQLQTFTFPDLPEIVKVITLFTTGELSLPAKRLLVCRSALYKQVKSVGQPSVRPSLRGVFDQDSKTAVVALAQKVGQ